MDTIGIALEIIGAILVSTSYIGPKRLVRWENTIRAYLHAQQPISHFAHQLKPTILTCFRALETPIIIILMILGGFFTFIWGFSLFGYFLGYFWQTIVEDLPLWANELLRIAIIIILLPLVFLSLSIAESVGSTLAFAFSYLLYGIFFLLCIVGYVIILILLIPYSAIDRIVIKFDLTTTLGVLGALCALLGVSLQLPPFRNFLCSLSIFG
jgi:hypothetical protein